jgi:replicative DNA helicase
MKELSQLNQSSSAPNEATGLQSGFAELDKLTTGWHNAELIVIAARTAMGKTAFALSMIRNMAINNQIPVALFSLEMSNVQLVSRLITNISEIEVGQIKSGQFTDDEWRQLDSKLCSLINAPLYVDDTPSLFVSELCTKASSLVREHGVKIIIVDYLQLLNAKNMPFSSRHEELGIIARSLKELAQELNVPVIALSQLPKDIDERESIDGKRPRMSDLRGRECGEIERYADKVCFIYRPEYYKIYALPDGTDLHGVAEMIVAKNNTGALGTAWLRFRGKYVCFKDIER